MLFKFPLQLSGTEQGHGTWSSAHGSVSCCFLEMNTLFFLFECTSSQQKIRLRKSLVDSAGRRASLEERSTLCSSGGRPAPGALPGAALGRAQGPVGTGGGPGSGAPAPSPVCRAREQEVKGRCVGRPWKSRGANALSELRQSRPGCQQGAPEGSRRAGGSACPNPSILTSCDVVSLSFHRLTEPLPRTGCAVGGRGRAGASQSLRLSVCTSSVLHPSLPLGVCRPLPRPSARALPMAGSALAVTQRRYQ